MNIAEAKNILRNDYSKFLELPIDIRSDNSIKDLALHEAMKQEDDDWRWQYFLLESVENISFDKKLDTSNNDRYMTLKIAEVTTNNIVYMNSLSDELRNDKEFFKELYKVRPKNFGWGYLEYGSKKIQSDSDIALLAIETNMKDFEHIDPSLLKNLEFLAKALNINPDLISRYVYSEEILKDTKFTKHLNKKNHTFVQEYLTSNKFLKDPFDNDESLNEEQGKGFLVYILSWFFFSEYRDNSVPFKLTSELEEKSNIFFKRCDLKNMSLLKNVSPLFFDINEENEIVKYAVTATEDDCLPFSLIARLPRVAIFKSFRIAIELLSTSSFLPDNERSHVDLLSEKMLREINIPGFDPLGNGDTYDSRWTKKVATLLLSQLSSWACILDEEMKSIHYYNSYILNLVRERFQSNEFIYENKYEENFRLALDSTETDRVSLTSLKDIIITNDISLPKYQKINEHFETSLETFIENNKSNELLLQEINNYLIEEYGLVINYKNNQQIGSYKEMLNFFSFQSNSDISLDFLQFIQKDKKYFCGINDELFKIPNEVEDDTDSEKNHKSAKFAIDGYQPINPQDLSNGYLVKVDEMDLWGETIINVALPIDSAKINKDKEFMFLDEKESMKIITGLGSFFVDTMKAVNEGEGVSISESEHNLFKKGELFLKNIDQKLKNFRVLEESEELINAINLCLPSDILFHLKEHDDVEQLATYKFSSDLFSIDEDMYSTIIKIIIIKYKSGSCEGLAIPFYQR